MLCPETLCPETGSHRGVLVMRGHEGEDSVLYTLLSGNVHGDRTLLPPLWPCAQHTVGALSVFVEGTLCLGLLQALNVEGLAPQEDLDRGHGPDETGCLAGSLFQRPPASHSLFCPSTVCDLGQSL